MTKTLENSLEIKESPIHGNGLFAVSPKTSGEVIGVALNKIGDTGDPDQDYSQTEIGRNINHSDIPNVKVIRLADGNLGIAAAEDIEAGEEILADYSQFSELMDNLREASFSLSKRAKHNYLKKKKEESGNITYIYSPKHVEKRNKAKAQRVQKLSKSISKVRKQVSGDLRAEDLNERYTALAVALMDETYERVGNDESAEEMGHFGVTTWKVKHVKFHSGKATISYVGKSGVKQKKEIANKTSVKLLKELARGKGKNDKLFVGDDYFITANKVNDYLHRFDITAKDIRGFHANDEMRAILKRVRSKGGKLPAPGKERESKLKKEFKEALEETAKLVGHTPGTLKNQYLVPGMFNAYVEKGTVIKDLAKSASLALNKEEYGFIKQCAQQLRALVPCEEEDGLFIVEADRGFRKILSLISRSYRKNDLKSPLLDSIKSQCQVFFSQNQEISDEIAGFQLSARASLLTAAEKPSEWKKDLFWFLKDQKEPPKGYMPSRWVRPLETEETKYTRPDVPVTIPHIPLKPAEAKMLSSLLKSIGMPPTDYLRQARMFTKYDDGEDPFSVDYLPLKIPWSRTDYSEFPATKSFTIGAVQFLEWLRKKFHKNEEAVAMFDDIIGRIREQQKGKESYKYDTVKPEIPPPTRMPASNWEVMTVQGLAEKLGWEVKPEAHTNPDEDRIDHFLPLTVKTPTGKDVKITKLLTKLKAKHPQDVYQGMFHDIEKRYSLLPRHEWTLVISAEPGDIMTMSTGRGWRSCITEGGCNFASLNHAVSGYDMVAYAIDDKTGKWLSRIWLRFDGKGWWPEPKVYGIGTPELADQLLAATKKYLEDHGILGETGKYHEFAKGWSDFTYGHIESKRQEDTTKKLLEEANTVSKESRKEKAGYKITAKEAEEYWLSDLLEKLPDTQIVERVAHPGRESSKPGKPYVVPNTFYLVFMPVEFAEIIEKHPAAKSIVPYSTYMKVISFAFSWPKYIRLEYPGFNSLPEDLQQKADQALNNPDVFFGVKDQKVVNQLLESRRRFYHFVQGFVDTLDRPGARIRQEGAEGVIVKIITHPADADAMLKILKGNPVIAKYIENLTVTDTSPAARRASDSFALSIRHPHEYEGANCFFHAALLALKHPDLTLIKGRHSMQRPEDTAHFWLETKSGEIVDPTASQYSPGEYLKEREVDVRANLDALKANPLFEGLPQEDKDLIDSQIRESAEIFLSKRASKEKHEGAMLAIMAPPGISRRLRKMIDKDTVSSDGLHLTLLYLGKAKELGESALEAIQKATEKVCARHEPLKMCITGAGVFSKGDKGTPVYLVPNAKGLSALQADLEQVIGSIVDLPSDHGWVPHMTIAYADDKPEIPELTDDFEWTAKSVRLQVAGEKVADIPIGRRSISKRAASAKEEELTYLYQLTAEALREAGGYEGLEHEWQQRLFDDMADALWNKDIPAANNIIGKIMKHVLAGEIIGLSKRAAKSYLYHYAPTEAREDILSEGLKTPYVLMDKEMLEKYRERTAETLDKPEDKVTAKDALKGLEMRRQTMFDGEGGSRALSAFLEPIPVVLGMNPDLKEFAETHDLYRIDYAAALKDGVVEKAAIVEEKPRSERPVETADLLKELPEIAISQWRDKGKFYFSGKAHAMIVLKDGILPPKYLKPMEKIAFSLSKRAAKPAPKLKLPKALVELYSFDHAANTAYISGRLFDGEFPIGEFKNKVTEIQEREKALSAIKPPSTRFPLYGAEISISDARISVSYSGTGTLGQELVSRFNAQETTTANLRQLADLKKQAEKGGKQGIDAFKRSLQGPQKPSQLEIENWSRELARTGSVSFKQYDNDIKNIQNDMWKALDGILPQGKAVRETVKDGVVTLRTFDRDAPKSIKSEKKPQKGWYVHVINVVSTKTPLKDILSKLQNRQSEASFSETIDNHYLKRTGIVDEKDEQQYKYLAAIFEGIPFRTHLEDVGSSEDPWIRRKIYGKKGEYEERTEAWMRPVKARLVGVITNIPEFRKQAEALKDGEGHPLSVFYDAAEFNTSAEFVVPSALPKLAVPADYRKPAHEGEPVFFRISPVEKREKKDFAHREDKTYPWRQGFMSKEAVEWITSNGGVLPGYEELWDKNAGILVMFARGVKPPRGQKGFEHLRIDQVQPPELQIHESIGKPTPELARSVIQQGEPFGFGEKGITTTERGYEIYKCLLAKPKEECEIAPLSKRDEKSRMPRREISLPFFPGSRSFHRETSAPPPPIARNASISPSGERSLLESNYQGSSLLLSKRAMRIEKSMLPTLWYENEEGERYVPEMDHFEPPPKGFIYQHTQFPTTLNHKVLRMIVRDEVDACQHPEEHVRPTGGWIDGIEGRECARCGGHQTRNTGQSWPGKWSSDGAKDFMSGSGGWPQDLVLTMANSKDWSLAEAIIIAANSCERCMNALAHKYGLEWGYPEHSEEWIKTNTQCDFCKDEPLSRKSFLTATASCRRILARRASISPSADCDLLAHIQQDTRFALEPMCQGSSFALEPGLSLSKRAEKPSEWKSGPFWFLKSQKEPPKGYQTTQWAKPHPAIPEPHMLLREEEYAALKEIESKLKDPAAIRNDTSLTATRPADDDHFKAHYMPLQVTLRGKRMPAMNALEWLKNRPNADLSLLESLIERLKESRGKKNTWLYDAAPQKQEDPTSYLDLSHTDAAELVDMAKAIGWPSPLATSTSFEGGMQSRLPTVVTDKHGRKIRVGKLITALLKKFPEKKDFLARITKDLSLVPKVTDWSLVVSAEPSDILTMSTGRGWKSCVTKGGCNFASLDYAVSTRDMVAYAVAPNKDNWLARVWLRSDGKGKWWPENKVYTTMGIPNDAFLKAVNDYLSSKGILGTPGDYHPMAKGWSDMMMGYIRQNKRVEKAQKTDPYRDLPEKPGKALKQVRKSPMHRLYEATVTTENENEFINLLKEIAGTDFVVLKKNAIRDKGYKLRHMLYDIKLSPEAAEALSHAEGVKAVREKGAAPETVSATVTLNPIQPLLLNEAAEEFANPDIAKITTVQEFMKLPDNIRDMVLTEMTSSLWNKIPWTLRSQFTYVRDGLKVHFMTARSNLKTLKDILFGQNYTIKEK